MGRHMAGYSFLRAFLPRVQEGSGGPLAICVDNRNHAQDFLAWARAVGCRPEARVIHRDQRSHLKTVGCLHLPGPGLGEEAWRRNCYGAASWSLTGLTHTTCSARVMEALSEFLVAPVQSWDALICTSTAVKGHVEQQLDAAADHLRHRLGAQRFVLPQLPVIPLGVISEDFAQKEDARPRARAALGLKPHEVVVLFMGRLSFHAKAHPVPMYLALEKAQSQLASEGIQLVLLEYGRHGVEAVAEAYREAQRLCCPSVRCEHLNGQDGELRIQALAGADLFCSLSDNIQEAFGLTPVEAKAAGLPVIVSDWDGYRDTVRHGVDGFRIPTLTPRPGLGNDLALQHGLETISYDRYVGMTAALTTVDVDGVTEALIQMARNPELRRTMGLEGQRHARATYDWNVVLDSYDQLWLELAHRRTDAGNAIPQKPKHPWPSRLDPFTGFQGYPSGWLEEDTLLKSGPLGPRETRKNATDLQLLGAVNFTANIQPTAEEQEKVLELLNTKDQRAGDLINAIHGQGQRRWKLLRGLVWMLKMGLIRQAQPIAVRSGPNDQKHQGSSG